MEYDFRGQHHSDVTTTAIYLHLINSLEGHLVLAHEDEMDMVFAVKEIQHS